MRVAFFCGSLEPGKDGVGDYTRRLAAQLIKKGHFATIISLHDGCITTATSSIQTEENTDIEVLRLPAGEKWSKRLTRTQQWINQFKPEWISLQYVPYAFHPKGLPFRLATRLKKLQYKGKWQIMFHELWVGKEDGAVWKMKSIAFLQQSIIRRMLLLLHPLIIHTQLPEYQSNLRQIGFTATALPLFSNIKQTSFTTVSNEPLTFRIAFFSQVEANRPIIDFLTALRTAVTGTGKKLEILLLGGSSKKMKAFRQQILHLEDPLTAILHAGFLSPELLSAQISSCSLGITPLLQKGLGKSGSVAAFIEHGLPVAVPMQDDTTNPFFYTELNEAIVHKPNLNEIALAATAAEKAKVSISLPNITIKFINDLAAVSRV